MSRILTSISAVVLSCGLAVGIAQAQTAHGGHGQDAAPMEGASAAYMEAMTRMNDDMTAMEMTGKPGVDFALMMIPHHQSAIDMAKAYLESGEGDAELVKLSEEIVAAQESEIAFLKSWLEKNGQ
jgi:uncharacterized protein (DUF305 family)